MVHQRTICEWPQIVGQFTSARVWQPGYLVRGWRFTRMHTLARVAHCLPPGTDVGAECRPHGLSLGVSKRAIGHAVDNYFPLMRTFFRQIF